MKTVLQTAPCRFCGQVIQFEEKGGLSEEQAVELATISCTCEDAVAYRRRMQQEKKALGHVSALFGEEAGAEHMAGEGVMAILHAAVCGICGGEIEKIALSLQGGIRATISQNSKGEIKVERTETKKRQLTG